MVSALLLAKATLNANNYCYIAPRAIMKALLR